MIGTAAPVQAVASAPVVFPASDGWVYVVSNDGRDLFVRPRSARRDGGHAVVEVAETYPTIRPMDMRGVRRWERFDCRRRTMMVTERPGPVIDIEGQLVQSSQTYRSFAPVDGPAATALFKAACPGHGQ